ncbi:hypothetical protein GGI23_007478, partial [Coemansia sp. RSA 2559]
MGEFGSDMAVDEPEPQSLLVMASSDNGTDDPFSIGSISISQAPASPDTSWLKTPQRQSQDAETTVVKEETVATTLFEKVGAEPMAKSPSEKEKAEFKAESPEAMEMDNYLLSENEGNAQATDASVAAANFAAAVAEATNDGGTTITGAEQNGMSSAPASDSEIKAEPTDLNVLSKPDLPTQPDADGLKESVFFPEVDMKDVSEDAGADETILVESQTPTVASSERLEQPELTTAKILADPELMYAAAIPLPGTPGAGNQIKTPIKSANAKYAADFMIPTDWLMDPSPSGRRLLQHAESPLKRFSSSPNGENANNLIPVTPANQKLLDSLEIQWMTPSRVPKFSDTEMDAVRAEYEEKMSRQNELREKLLETLKNEYSTNMRKQQDMAEQTLKEAEDMFQKMVEHKEREAAEKLA